MLFQFSRDVFIHSSPKPFIFSRLYSEYFCHQRSVSSPSDAGVLLNPEELVLLCCAMHLWKRCLCPWCEGLWTPGCIGQSISLWGQLHNKLWGFRLDIWTHRSELRKPLGWELKRSEEQQKKCVLVPCTESSRNKFGDFSFLISLV